MKQMWLKEAGRIWGFYIILIGEGQEEGGSKGRRMLSGKIDLSNTQIEVQHSNAQNSSMVSHFWQDNA